MPHLENHRLKPMPHTGRPTLVEIDLNALKFNYLKLRKIAGKGVKVLVVLKANAYGHGAIPLARLLSNLGVDFIGLAMAEEAVELREAGIKTPIIILGCIFPGQEELITKYGLETTISSLQGAESLNLAAGKRGLKVKVHLKVDTGMGRLGFMPEGLRDSCKTIKNMKNLQVKGLLSHLADADNEDSSFTLDQMLLFNKICGFVDGSGISPEIKHIANSSSLLKFPDSHMDMIRLGITLYGSYPSEWSYKTITLRPVLSFKTKVCHIKRVPPGYSISYGCTYRTKRESVIATIPVGYADGYPRSFSNQGKVLIRGKRAKVAGRVTMDMVMLDVTDVEGASVGDEAVLIGSQGNEVITAEDWGRMLGTISYEIFCSISSRVPRVYRT